MSAVRRIKASKQSTNPPSPSSCPIAAASFPPCLSLSLAAAKVKATMTMPAASHRSRAKAARTIRASRPPGPTSRTSPLGQAGPSSCRRLTSQPSKPPRMGWWIKVSIASTAVLYGRRRISGVGLAHVHQSAGIDVIKGAKAFDGEISEPFPFDFN